MQISVICAAMLLLGSSLVHAETGLAFEDVSRQRTASPAGE